MGNVLIAYFLGNMCAKHYENPTMLSRVTAKNVGDVFLETHCTYSHLQWINYYNRWNRWNQNQNYSNVAFSSICKSECSINSLDFTAYFFLTVLSSFISLYYWAIYILYVQNITGVKWITTLKPNNLLVINGVNAAMPRRHVSTVWRQSSLVS